MTPPFMSVLSQMKAIRTLTPFYLRFQFLSNQTGVCKEGIACTELQKQIKWGHLP